HLPFRKGASGKHLPQCVLDFSLMRGVETCSFTGQLGTSDDFKQSLLKLRFKATDGEVAAIPGLVVTIKRTAIQHHALSLRFYLAAEIACSGHVVQCKGSIRHADIHLLSLACL